MKTHLLVSTLDNDNIGVLKLTTDTDKFHDIRSALSKSKKLRQMLVDEFGGNGVKFKEADIKVKIGHTGITAVIEAIFYGKEDYKDEITLNETWIY